MTEQNKILRIDLNCDMGEGMGNDKEIMPFISSANIACGYHAGDETTMKETIELAIQNNVAIGAHPSFDDKENFGRKEMNLSSDEIYSLIFDQIKTLDAIARQGGTILRHVKPHGVLYNMSAKNFEIAKAIANAVWAHNKKLILFGLSGSHSISEAKKIGLRTASEVFADRTYQDDGSLTSRSENNALIEDEIKAVQQVLQMIKDETVTTVSGKKIPIVVETICIHGDGKHAIAFAKKINENLKKENIKIRPVDK
jgi:UPF0271 protein